MKNPNHIPSSAWTQSNIENLFINQLVKKEPDIILSEASSGKCVNISATPAQWNNAGVNTDGTQASITRTDLKAISTAVRKFVDDYRADKQEKIRQLQTEIESIYPYEVYSIKINGRGI